MSRQLEPQRSVASVLVIAAESAIESLLAELVAFAGYRPLFDPAAGAAGDSVRRLRPDVMMLDTSLAPATVQACLDAADETGAGVILTSSTANETELRTTARLDRRLYFPLPGAPRPLAQLIARALAEKPVRRVTAIPDRLQVELRGSVHPAMCAALASDARARALVGRTHGAPQENLTLREGIRAALAEMRRGRSALQAAVTDYTRQLQAASLSMDAVLRRVSDAIHDCAGVVGAESSVAMLLAESEVWARNAYQAVRRESA